VTASHNPAADNGYKVYWGNASQITAPHDKGIASAIVANLAPWPLDVPHLLASPLVSNPTRDVSAAFYAAIREWNFYPEENAASKLKIVFTPMHGVGGKWTHRAFQTFALPDFFPVMTQLYPDPDFPTVAFPNPEEGKGALKLAFASADRVGAPLVIANDPDSDRLAAAEKVPGGEWRPFSGNEIGTLLAHWTLTQYRRKHPGVDSAKLLFVNTTVSSKMMAAIARKEGIRYEETLTGFKWIGDCVLRLEREEGLTLLLAFEQAIGYMVGNICPDKVQICHLLVLFFLFFSSRTVCERRLFSPKWQCISTRRNARHYRSTWTLCICSTGTWQPATRTFSATIPSECLASLKT
jgi:phosphomannomutase